MLRTKTYRNISAKIRFFGLEIGDWGALAAAAGAVFAVSSNILLNGAAMAALWVWMRKVKSAKPEGYTMAWLSLRGSPKKYLCGVEHL